MEYTDKVMDHFTNPRNVGELKDANAIGEVGSAACGDIMKIWMKINDKGIIEQVTFKTFGCASAIASSSLATEMLKGKTVEYAKNLTNKMLIEELGGLPTHKIHCSVLAEEAIKSALENYEKNKK